MPKMKTVKGISKRFRKTKNGKLVYSHAFARHLMTGKNTKRKRKLRKKGIASPVEFRRYAPLLHN